MQMSQVGIICFTFVHFVNGLFKNIIKDNEREIKIRTFQQHMIYTYAEEHHRGILYNRDKDNVHVFLSLQCSFTQPTMDTLL